MKISVTPLSNTINSIQLWIDGPNYKLLFIDCNTKELQFHCVYGRDNEATRFQLTVNEDEVTITLPDTGNWFSHATQGRYSIYVFLYKEPVGQVRYLYERCPSE